MEQNVTYHRDGYRIDWVNAHVIGPVAIFFADRAPDNDSALQQERKMAAEMGLAAAFVVPDRPSWYQGAGAGRLFAHLRRIARGASRTTLIGAGMGAYGALRAASLFEVDEVVALSPVATINPRIGPMDWRFDEDFAHLGVCDLPQTHRAGRYTVIYDPGSIEKRHLASLALPPVRSRLCPLPCSVGAAVSVLVMAGAYRRVVQSAIRTDRPENLTALLRAVRRTSTEYLRLLAVRNLEARPGVSWWAVQKMQEIGGRPWVTGRLQRRVARVAPHVVASA